MVDIGADVVGGGKDRIDDGLRQGGFLFDFITGTGDAYRYYGQTSAEVADLRRSAGAQVIRDAFVANGCRSTSNIFYDTRPAFRDTVFNPTSTAFQVGGFAGASAVKEGNGMLRITVSNVAGANSLLYHIVPNAPWSTGPLRTIHQTFEWREAVPAACQG